MISNIMRYILNSVGLRLPRIQVTTYEFTTVVLNECMDIPDFDTISNSGRNKILNACLWGTQINIFDAK
jgi:hypothetical protein